MRFLLINPFCPISEGPTPPLGIAFLAAVLEKAGINVRVLDLAITPYSEERLASILYEFKPEIVGITAVTMTFLDAIRVIKDIKKVDPSLLTVMGGPHVSFCATETLNQYPELDLIVIGEGEVTIVELAEEAQQSRDWSKVKGLAFRQEAEVCISPARELLDVNTLPFPARHLLPIGRYRALNTAISMTTSRGCPCRCIFCVGRKMVGSKVRYRNPQDVVDELAYLSTLGFPQINLADDLFTAKRSHCITICDEIIRRKLNIRWTSFARVDTVSLEVLQKMKAAGCTTISFGVESANAEILKLVKKGITIPKVIKAIEMCKEVGIDPHVSFILGLPGETPETLEETQAFGDVLDKMGGAYGFHLLAPFPGTAICDENDKYDLTILTKDWPQYHANRAIVETTAVKKEMLNKIAEQWDSEVVVNLERIKQEMLTGEATEFDAWQIYNLERFTFLYDLMMAGLIEKNGSWLNGQEPVDKVSALQTLAERIYQDAGKSLDETLDFLKDLVLRNGLNYAQEEGTIKWEWNEYLS
ncbi:MAG: B12-binding domain-containing radical SAM protein [Deltaproteobacteria bacterium]|jgi:anaerobic magnesium-protoporphyrin IX monomethyl ester cyclase|nr:B12-binding domain-containing radical SAM protein [Deltaproteobacteria bacterium]MBT4266309.1 B12-binding domain-containing radical SAM protein [Deltaproteobacteria bacterium]MBT4640019.1 B12-binding domain-containing radical SAM protein [Deltaproteobacteria bacterium]MBT6503112.1 B12-binding domain-containing radical SAM protein [Deltaproteobacteria bacterium]MBT6611936.1 B12-binding domain-containing radical SAM protein [Deltaproteobacteria bacterium]